MEGMEMIAFQIIAAVGTARSLYIEAIDLASEGKYDEARAKIKEGEEAFNDGHKAHGELLTKFANGELPSMDILMTQAEDQLMSAEAFGILANKFITLYEKVNR
ncbi:MAG: PTS lactose/cellobiose transporter subunit IIA [Firmicutes bacterium]|nr:PTS lactose/cellobiose transporter subunit IIA [Bacillota bacterium]